MSKWSLNGKFYFVLSIFIVASVAISFLGVNKMEHIKEDLDGIVEGPTKKQGRVLELQSLYFIQLINEKNFIISTTLEEMQVHGKRLADRHEEVKKASATLYETLHPAGKKELEDFNRLYESWWSLNKEIRDLALQGNEKEAGQMSLTKGRDIRLQIEKIMDSIINRNNSIMAETVTSADADYKTARLTIILVSTFAISLGLLLATFVLRALKKSIDQIIANLTDSSHQVTSAAKQIASSSEELSQAATEQAASLEETAASIEEMNSMVQKNAENARRTSDISVSSSENANKGKLVVTDMIKAIEDISESNSTIMQQIDESNQQISDIVKVIAEIGNKTKVINDIVFQTKLLSFNASVEAARAGEHGKGFAVVAEEVGNLAQMSGNAAKEISAMLDGSIQKVEGIVNETKQKVSHLVQNGRGKIEVGTRIAQQCGQVLDEIVENVNSVSQMAQEISTACQEQSQGVQEITRAMTQLDQVTQTNAATSEEAASAAEELSSQSESLKSTVGELTVAIRGGDAKMETLEETRSEVQEVRKQPKKAANVLPLKQKPKAEAPRMKQAVGHRGSAVPSENDPRFEEV